MEAYRPGEIVLVSFPFADAMGARRRPAHTLGVKRMEGEEESGSQASGRIVQEEVKDPVNQEGGDRMRGEGKQVIGQGIEGEGAVLQGKERFGNWAGKTARPGTDQHPRKIYPGARDESQIVFDEKSEEGRQVGE